MAKTTPANNKRLSVRSDAEWKARAASGKLAKRLIVSDNGSNNSEEETTPNPADTSQDKDCLIWKNGRSMRGAREAQSDNKNCDGSGKWIEDRKRC